MNTKLLTTHQQRRRHLLLGCCGALAAGLFTSLPGQAAGLLDSVVNPCNDPGAMANIGTQGQDLVHAALQGLDTRLLLDTHAHLLGTGDSGSGCTVHPSMQQWWHPTEVLRRKAILNAACVPGDAASVDLAFVARLQALAQGFPPGAAWWLFAFEQACDDSGQPRPDWTSFHVPNAYAARVAQQLTAQMSGQGQGQGKKRFDWVASVHPYRADALARLDSALASGAVAVKWLPSAMNIDPRDPRCKPFCERLVRAGVPLIVHCGEEKAVPGAGQDALGNPLLLRPLLALGTRVVVAHCASLGHAVDTDLRSAPQVPAFDLFARLMNERQWQGQLLGDVSAVFQRNRTPQVWRAVLQQQAWHGRLLHGSDHPLPGLMPLFSLSALHRAGLLPQADIAGLQAIRQYNPLLFDLVLKRRLRVGGPSSPALLPAAVFEGRALRPATVS